MTAIRENAEILDRSAFGSTAAHHAETADRPAAHQTAWAMIREALRLRAAAR
jgi:hypothetical protein